MAAHDQVATRIGKFLPEPPPRNDDGKFVYPPDPLRVALEYLTKLGERPPVKEDKSKKNDGKPGSRGGRRR